MLSFGVVLAPTGVDFSLWLSILGFWRHAVIVLKRGEPASL